MEHCKEQGYSYSGVQYQFECYCGNEQPPVSAKVDPAECNFGCAGDGGQVCGAGCRMNVYKIAHGALANGPPH